MKKKILEKEMISKMIMEEWATQEKEAWLNFHQAMLALLRKSRTSSY